MRSSFAANVCVAIAYPCVAADVGRGLGADAVHATAFPLAKVLLAVAPAEQSVAVHVAVLERKETKEVERTEAKQGVQ
jgi:hypothetical protein